MQLLDSSASNWLAEIHTEAFEESNNNKTGHSTSVSRKWPHTDLETDNLADNWKERQVEQAASFLSLKSV